MNHSLVRPAWLLMGMVAALLALTGCNSNTADGAPDYPVTILPSDAPGQVALTVDRSSPAPLPTATLDWSVITVLPLPTTEGETVDAPAADATVETTGTSIPDPLTAADREWLTPAGGPFELSDAELTLGRLVMPLDLLGMDEFSIQSVEIDGYPGWHFLMFDLPTPADKELGPVVRAPISGEVWPGTMQMVNDQTVQTVSVDHTLEGGQILRATFVYSGTVEPLYALGQTVQAGEVILRLTDDTGRLDTLGSTPLPAGQGAILTLHASIDTVVEQESGAQSLKFLRGINWTPEQFLRNDDGLILTPTSAP